MPTTSHPALLLSLLLLLICLAPLAVRAVPETLAVVTPPSVEMEHPTTGASIGFSEPICENPFFVTFDVSANNLSQRDFIDSAELSFTAEDGVAGETVFVAMVVGEPFLQTSAQQLPSAISRAAPVQAEVAGDDDGFGNVYAVDVTATMNSALEDESTNVDQYVTFVIYEKNCLGDEDMVINPSSIDLDATFSRGAAELELVDDSQLVDPMLAMRHFTISWRMLDNSGAVCSSPEGDYDLDVSLLPVANALSATTVSCTAGNCGSALYVRDDTLVLPALITIRVSVTVGKAGDLDLEASAGPVNLAANVVTVRINPPFLPTTIAVDNEYPITVDLLDFNGDIITSGPHSDLNINCDVASPGQCNFPAIIITDTATGTGDLSGFTSASVSKADCATTLFCSVVAIDVSMPSTTPTITGSLATNVFSGTLTFNNAEPTVVEDQSFVAEFYLNHMPSENIQIALSDDSSGAMTMTPAGPLVFGTSNWSSSVSVTFSAIDDPYDNLATFTSVTLTYTLTNSGTGNEFVFYQNNVVQTYNYVIEDDDLPKGLTPPDGSLSSGVIGPHVGVNEASGMDTFGVTLDAYPDADVVVAFTPEIELLSSPAALTFTNADWSIAQTVTVTAKDDTSLSAFDATVQVSAAATSGDGAYDGLTYDVGVVIYEDDILTCPLQTTSTESPSETTFGIMFDVSLAINARITELAPLLTPETVTRLTVYYSDLSHVEVQDNPWNWTYHTTALVTSAGTGIGSPIAVDIPVAASSTRAIYITSTQANFVVGSAAGAAGTLDLTGEYTTISFGRALSTQFNDAAANTDVSFLGHVHMCPTSACVSDKHCQINGDAGATCNGRVSFQTCSCTGQFGSLTCTNGAVTNKDVIISQVYRGPDFSYINLFNLGNSLQPLTNYRLKVFKDPFSTIPTFDEEIPAACSLATGTGVAIGDNGPYSSKFSSNTCFDVSTLDLGDANAAILLYDNSGQIIDAFGRVMDAHQPDVDWVVPRPSNQDETYPISRRPNIDGATPSFDVQEWHFNDANATTLSYTKGDVPYFVTGPRLPITIPGQGMVYFGHWITFVANYGTFTTVTHMNVTVENPDIFEVLPEIELDSIDEPTAGSLSFAIAAGCGCLGDNLVTIELQFDGATTMYYPFYIPVGGNLGTDPELRSLVLLDKVTFQEYPLTPVFDPLVYEYQAVVPEDVSEVQMNVNTTDSGAYVSVNGLAVAASTMDLSGLVVGTNVFHVVSTAEDSISSVSFLLTISRGETNVANMTYTFVNRMPGNIGYLDIEFDPVQAIEPTATLFFNLPSGFVLSNSLEWDTLYPSNNTIDDASVSVEGNTIVFERDGGETLSLANGNGPVRLRFWNVTNPTAGGGTGPCTTTIRAQAGHILEGPTPTASDCLDVFAAPGAPSAITFSEVFGSRFIVSWTPGSSGGTPVTQYQIAVNGIENAWRSSAPFYSATGLTPLTSYSLTVTAVNIVGASANSSVFVQTTPYGEPVITSFEPKGSSFAGGARVTLQGNYFTPNFNLELANETSLALAVGDEQFPDGLPCAAIEDSSETYAVCVTGATGVGENMTAAIGSVVLTTQFGVWSSGDEEFVFDGEPSITSVSPLSGPSIGGTVVQLEGAYLGLSADQIQSLTIAGVDCGLIEWHKEDNVTCTTAASPAAIGPVVLTTKVGSAESPSMFEYVAPVIASFSPTLGPANVLDADSGTVITLTGTRLGETAEDVVSISIDGAACNFFGPGWISPEEIVCLTLGTNARVGEHPIEIFTTSGFGGNSGSKTFFFHDVGRSQRPPAVTLITPKLGPSTGDTPVTISGRYLGDSSDDLTGVTIANETCAILNWFNSSSITCSTGASDDFIGLGRIEVTTTSGGSGDGSELDVMFNYTQTRNPPPDSYPSPILYGISPRQVGEEGGTLVTIRGNFFGELESEVSATIGGAACTGGSWISTYEVTCRTPPSSALSDAGVTDVQVQIFKKKSAAVDLGLAYILVPCATPCGYFGDCVSGECKCAGGFSGPTCKTSLFVFDPPLDQALMTNEDGDRRTFTVRLSRSADSGVELSFSANKTNELSVSPKKLTWDTSSTSAKTVTVRGVKDGVRDGTSTVLLQATVEGEAGNTLYLPGRLVLNSDSKPVILDVMPITVARDEALVTFVGTDFDSTIALELQSYYIIMNGTNQEFVFKDPSKDPYSNDFPEGPPPSGSGSGSTGGSGSGSAGSGSGGSIGSGSGGSGGSGSETIGSGSAGSGSGSGAGSGSVGGNATRRVRYGTTQATRMRQNETGSEDAGSATPLPTTPTPTPAATPGSSSGNETGYEDYSEFDLKLLTARMVNLEDGYHTVTISNMDGSHTEVKDAFYATVDCTGPNAKGIYGKGDDCGACPTGAVCPGGQRLWPAPGYWNGGENAGFVARCQPEERCLGGRDSACASGYEGDFCGECSSGFYNTNGVCRECPAVVMSVLMILAALIVWGCLAAAVILIENRRTVSIFVFGFMACQVVSGFGDSSPYKLEGLAQRVYDVMRLFSPELAVSKPGCLGAQAYVVDFIGGVIFALLLVSFIVAGVPITGMVMKSLLKKRGVDQSKIDDRAKYYSKRSVWALHLGLMLLYYPLTSRALQALACRSAGDSSYLMTHPHIKCFSGVHLAAVGVALGILVLLSLGYPIFLAIFFKRNKDLLWAKIDFVDRNSAPYELLSVNMHWFVIYDFFFLFVLSFGRSFLIFMTVIHFAVMATLIVAKLPLLVWKRPYDGFTVNMFVFVKEGVFFLAGLVNMLGNAGAAEGVGGVAFGALLGGAALGLLAIVFGYGFFLVFIRKEIHGQSEMDLKGVDKVEYTMKQVPEVISATDMAKYDLQFLGLSHLINQVEPYVVDENGELVCDENGDYILTEEEVARRKLLEDGFECPIM